MTVSKPKPKPIFSVSLLFALTLGLFAPLDAYLGSVTEFWFSWSHILPALLVSSVLLFALGIGMGAVLPRKIKNVWVALLFIVGVGLYLQGQILNISYGVLDGKEIDWGAYKGYAVFNTLVWGALIVAVCVALRRSPVRSATIIRWISLFLVYIQLAGLSITGVRQRAHLVQPANGVLTTDGLFSIGEDENVFVFILDTLGSDFFEHLLEQRPEIKELFDGFQYFADFSTTYPTTRGALPFILTGIYNDNKMSTGRYIAKAYDSTPFYKDLNELGFDIRLYTMNGFVPLSQARYIANKIDRSAYPSSTTGLAAKLYRYALFRTVPHVLKPFFWLHTGDFDIYRATVGYSVYQLDDPLFYETLRESKLQVGTHKAYRFYHFWGMHSPHVLNENMERVDQSTAEAQARGLMRMMEEYFQQLKALGLYDTATIIVTGDHPKDVLPRHLGKSRTAFLLKPKHARGLMTTNFLPASHADMLPTIMAEVSDKKRTYGLGLTHEEMSENRKRRLFHYQWENQWNKTYLPVLTEYEVAPQAWNNSSYQPTGNIYRGDESPENIYQGEWIDFTQRPTIGMFYGFSRPERTFTWNDGEKGYLFLKVKNAKKYDYQASLGYAGTLGRQRLVIKGSGKILWKGDLKPKGDTIRFTIPRKLVNNELDIEFLYPDAKRPIDLGMNRDTRLLAVRWTGMQFSPDR